jgi:hypothetical protein
MSDAVFRLPLARLARTPRAWFPIGIWVAVAWASALAAREEGTSASSVLQTVFGALSLPLLCFAVAGAVLEGGALQRATRALTSFGALPARVALATIAVAVVACALLSAVAGAGVAIVAHGPGDPPLAHDAAATAWVATLGGAAYGALFCFGSSYGKRGGGRVAALVLDWMLGAGTGTLASFTPRAHVRSLLGGESVLLLPGRASERTLVLLAVVFTLLAARRARRA